MLVARIEVGAGQGLSALEPVEDIAATLRQSKYFDLTMELNWRLEHSNIWFFGSIYVEHYAENGRTGVEASYCKAVVHLIVQARVHFVFPKTCSSLFTIALHIKIVFEAAEVTVVRFCILVTEVQKPVILVNLPH